ncbi:MAG: Na+/H+ antiporter NhaA [Phenylobacterium sp.]|nr:Na+/H+ antiporter NhaA [Phenylobacterium sp.]
MSTRSTLAYLRTETGSGLLPPIVALVAIVWANTPWAPAYFRLISHPLPVQVGPFAETMGLGAWITAALMPVLFFVLGLELKHEVLRGELSSPRRLALPLLGAAGGVVLPALVFVAINAGPGGAPYAWLAATPTDIAFALVVLALAGPRLPPTLRMFILTIALVQNVATGFAASVLYGEALRFPMLAAAAATLAVLAAMSRWRAAPYAFWAAGGLLLWAFMLKSGVGTALAGLALALIFPLEPKRPGGAGVLQETMDALHPYVAFLILPLFVFVAAGFPLSGGADRDLIAPVSLGLAAALAIAKPAGVFGAATLAIGLKWARRPTGARWIELLGASALCGVGFTLSLFAGALAFPTGDIREDQMRAGVVIGSGLAAAFGLGLLAFSAARRAREAGA